jgi:glycolate oxidase
MSSPCFDRVLLPAEAKKQIVALIGPRGYLDRPEDLTLYEYDGSVDKSTPEIVVFPKTTDEVAAIVKIAAEHGVPAAGRFRGPAAS